MIPGRGKGMVLCRGVNGKGKGKETLTETRRARSITEEERAKSKEQRAGSKEKKKSSHKGTKDVSQIW